MYWTDFGNWHTQWTGKAFRKLLHDRADHAGPAHGMVYGVEIRRAGLGFRLVAAANCRGQPGPARDPGRAPPDRCECAHDPRRPAWADRALASTGAARELP